jgi:hypothetical protein
LSITRFRQFLLKAGVALSLAFLCWLYARSRHQETIDDVLVPVHVALMSDDLGRHEVEVNGTNRVMVSFAGPPSRIRELRGLLQRGTVQVKSTVVIPEDKQSDGSYRDTVRVEPGDLAVPPGVAVMLCEGHNTVPVTVHKISERLIPVRLESVGDARISQIKVEPAMVLVRGPQDVLEQIRAIPTQPFPLPPAPDSAFSNEPLFRGEVSLVKEIDGRAIQCSPATVAFRCRIHPRQRTYELTDVPISFLCPPGFPWKPTFTTPAAGKATIRVVGPAADDNPQVQAYIDLTQGTFEAGRNREPLKLYLPKDYVPVNDGPRLVSFILEPQ